MLPKIILFLFFGWNTFLFSQDSILKLEGIYQGSNLYIQNPMADDGVEYCASKVYLNGKIILDSTAMNGAFEIDLLVVNNQDVVAIECKSNLSIDDVNEHLERLEKIKRFLPDHVNKRISGAVAGMVIPANVATYAIKKGLYVIGQNGEHLELRNEKSFAAKTW